MPFKAVLLLTVSACCLRGDQWLKTFPLTGPPELRLESNEASIFVSASNASAIEVRVSTAGWKISDSDVRIVAHSAGNVLELNVLTPKLRMAFGKRSVRVDLRIPRETNCNIQAGLGSIAITGVKGRFVLTTRRGDIAGVGLDGKVEATTGEGKIRFEGRLDTVNLRTGFGTVDLEAAPGSRMFSEWRVSADSGAITVYLPPNFSADLDAHTAAGQITLDFPHTLTGTPEEGAVRAKINAGGEALLLRTSSGNIKLLPPTGKHHAKGA